MSALRQAIVVEMLKARRSNVPLFTALGFSLAPIAGGFFMVVLKDPELARNMGLISVKAQIIAGSADWPAYFGMLAQAVSIGGMVVFSFIVSWVFGREYSDHTIKDLLALPTSRRSIVYAKFIVIAIWSALLTMLVVLLGLAIGAIVVLPLASNAVFFSGISTMLVCAVMTIIVMLPIGFFAGAGRGYLAPMGIAMLVLILAQLVGATGWGEFFPWSIPAMYSGAAGPEAAQMGVASFIVVFVTGILGVIATVYWWEHADHTH
ncbi:MAG: ABC transporter permease [Bacteroidota bacterium]